MLCQCKCFHRFYCEKENKSRKMPMNSYSVCTIEAAKKSHRSLIRSERSRNHTHIQFKWILLILLWIHAHTHTQPHDGETHFDRTMLILCTHTIKVNMRAARVTSSAVVNTQERRERTKKKYSKMKAVKNHIQHFNCWIWVFSLFFFPLFMCILKLCYWYSFFFVFFCDSIMFLLIRWKKRAT